MISELLEGSLASLAYLLVGVVLLAVGFLVVDVLTPGKLGDLIWRERNGNAAIVLCSGLVSITVVIVTAILTSDDGIVDGLVSTAVYGVVGLVLLAVTFGVVDALTPGKLGEILVADRPHPAAWVTAVLHVAVGVIVAASIS